MTSSQGWNGNNPRRRISSRTTTAKPFLQNANYTAFSAPPTILTQDSDSRNFTGNTTMVRRSERQLYYDQNYDHKTGVRIATTLGSFFLVVLLTLLYKSKCKHKDSRLPTPEPEAHLLPPSFIPTTPQQFIQLNQIHPIQKNNHCFQGQQPPPHPAVLLTSAGSSDSSSSIGDRVLGIGGPYFQNNLKTKAIEVHVILPTPTISPSSSEHFHPSQDFLRRQSDSATMIAFPNNYILDSLKYMDDTSSENIPDDGDGTSLTGSDSVFNCSYDERMRVIVPPIPPPPPLPPRADKRRLSSLSGYSGLSVSPNVTYVQVHGRRESYASSEVEEFYDYLEDGNNGGSSSRRRSSSTQTTLSDLQHCLTLATPSPRLSPSNFNFHMSLKSPKGPHLLRPGLMHSRSQAPSPRAGMRWAHGERKRSVDAMLMRRALLPRSGRESTDTSPLPTPKTPEESGDPKFVFDITEDK